jgi:hypothetical protein
LGPRRGDSATSQERFEAGDHEIEHQFERCGGVGDATQQVGGRDHVGEPIGRQRQEAGADFAVPHLTLLRIPSGTLTFEHDDGDDEALEMIVQQDGVLDVEPGAT